MELITHPTITHASFTFQGKLQHTLTTGFKTNTQELPIAIDSCVRDNDMPIIIPLPVNPNSTPTIRPIDTANSSLPSNMSINWDILQKSIGFVNMKLVLQHIDKVALNTITIPNIGRNPIKDRGDSDTP